MKKLGIIQEALKAPKGQYNSFGRYNYRSLEDILTAVKPLLAANNATLKLSDEMVVIGDRYYIKATATFRDEDTNIVETVTAYARESLDKKGMDESQITGTASSYARKYALNGLFLIDDTKDADTDEYHSQTERKADVKKAEAKKTEIKKAEDPKKAPGNKEATESKPGTVELISEDDVNLIRDRLLAAKDKGKNLEESALCASFGITTLEEMTKVQLLRFDALMAKAGV